MQTKHTASPFSIKALVCIALNVSFITVCSWISLPFTVSFTLQTFAIFLIAFLFSAKVCLLSVLTYISIGFLGVPVFSGFQAGPTALFGATGGYLIGFIPCVFLTSFIAKKTKGNSLSLFFASLIGLIICYFFGTLWYVIVYMSFTDIFKSLIFASTYCVLPFIIPDIIKILLAITISKRLLPYKQRLLCEL